MTYEILWLPLIFAKFYSFIPLLLVKRNVDLSWSVWVLGRGLLASWCLLAAVRGFLLGGTTFVPLQFFVHCSWCSAHPSVLHCAVLVELQEGAQCTQQWLQNKIWGGAGSLYFQKKFCGGKRCARALKKPVKSVLAFHKSSLCFLIGFNSKGNLDMSAALELKY